MIYLIFFLSGVAALTYQVAWMKILTVEFGTTVYAAATVLTVFMAGLGIGAWLFGRRVDRSSSPLVLYAVLELSLAGYAVVFLLALPVIHHLYVIIERAFAPSYTSFSLLKLAISALLLLPPTALMGGTLPVLAKHVGIDDRTRGRSLGLLYSFNTLGAMAGAAVIAFVWIVAVGVRGSILIAAAINVALGLAALWLAARRPARLSGQTKRMKITPREAPSASIQPTDARLRPVAIFIAFISGFTILACEVLWTRLFINFLSANALIFAVILIAVLAGLATGAFVSSLLAQRIRRLAPVLGVVQLCSAALLAAMVFKQTAIAGWLARAHESGNPLLPFLTLLMLLFVPCSVLGVTFPVLLSWGSREAATVGADVGVLYAVNTLGSVLGSLTAGFVLIAALGVNTSLLLLAVLYGAASLVLFPSWPARAATGAFVAVLVGLFFAPSLRQPLYWFNNGFTSVIQVPPENTEFLEEGVSSTVGITRIGDVRDLTVNGVIVAETARHDLWDLLSKAHLPMLIHPSPRRVALVGLGAGVSLGAVEKYDLDVLECIELSPEVVRACRRFEDVNQGALDDPRLRLVVNDGRHHLMTTRRKYDVINVDPIDPPVCTLYSRDFFQVCHDRLAEGGLMVQWVPVFRLSPDNIAVIFNAFLEVFEHSTVWYNGTAALLVGSKGRPLEIDASRFISRARQPRVRESLALIGNPDPWLLLSMFVGTTRRFDQVAPGPIPENSDDRPYLEYTVLRSADSMVAKEYWTLRFLEALASPIDDVLSGEMSPEDSWQLARMRQITSQFYSVRLLLFQGREDEAAAAVQSAIRQYQINKDELRVLMTLFALGG
jgi:spermidine synthase